MIWLHAFSFWLRTMSTFLKAMFQLMYGIWYINRFPKPIVTIFGGSRIKSDDYYAFQATRLAQRCIDNNISVLTGGGPGIMDAATCGAVYSKEGKGRSLGIGVRMLHQPRSRCLTAYLEVDQFFARKWLLMRYSAGFVVFPGGFGTCNELFELLTLMEMKFMDYVPLILIGKEYWEPFITWLNTESIRHGLISKKELEWISITDDLDIVFTILHKYCKDKVVCT